MSYHYDGPGPDSDEGMKRMAEDLALVTDPSRWPGPVLNMKLQPWKARELGDMRFGQIKPNQWTVTQANGTTIPYSSPAALVRDWSVD